MTRQRDSFLNGEGDAWFARNPGGAERPQERADSDVVLRALDHLALAPGAVLEVGAGNGWRVAAMLSHGANLGAAIEPSAAAVADGMARFPSLDIRRGTADTLPWDDASFDLVIAGFCLYLVDRADLFRMAAEFDRVLKDGGAIAIHDFWTPRPQRRAYTHRAGVYSYKMDYAALFAWNPAYTLIHHDVAAHHGDGFVADPDEWVAVSVLHKDTTRAYPLAETPA